MTCMETFAGRKDSVARTTAGIIWGLQLGGTLMWFCPWQNRKKSNDEIFWWNLLRTLIWETPGKQTGRTCGRDITAEWSLTERVMGATTMNLSCNWGAHQPETSMEMKRSGSTGWWQDDKELAEWCINKKRDVILRHARVLPCTLPL